VFPQLERKKKNNVKTPKKNKRTETKQLKTRKQQKKNNNNNQQKHIRFGEPDLLAFRLRSLISQILVLVLVFSPPLLFFFLINEV